MEELTKKTDKSYHRRIFLERTGKELVCALLCIMSLLPFLILFMNASRSSEAIKAGISLLPGGNLTTNWTNFMDKQNGMQLTVFRGNDQLLYHCGSVHNPFCICFYSYSLWNSGL